MSSIVELPKLDWIKNDTAKFNTFADGSAFLVAIEVHNSTTDTDQWEFDCVQFQCDEDRAFLYYRDTCDIYDKWSWDQFEYFVLLEGEMPTSMEHSENE